MSTHRRTLAAAPAALLVAIAAWETCATRVDATSVPGDAAWDRASTLVRQAWAPGDLIVFAPRWVDPVGRLHLGDKIPIEMAARMDSARYGRIWELSIRGARAPEVADLASTSASPVHPVRDDDVDGVRVRLYERTPAIVTADVLDHAADTHGAARLVLAEVGFEPHRCLLVPSRAGAPVRVTIPQLALGRELVGAVGIADVFTRRDVRTPVVLDVEIGGRLVAHAAAGIDDGWVRFAASTTPGPADVTFVARAAENGRQICFAAEARQ